MNERTIAVSKQVVQLGSVQIAAHTRPSVDGSRQEHRYILKGTLLQKKAVGIRFTSPMLLPVSQIGELFCINPVVRLDTKF